MEPNKETKIEVQGDVGQMNTGDINQQNNYITIFVSVISNGVEKGIDLLKNAQPNNVSVTCNQNTELFVSQREIDLRVGLVVFMLATGFGFFAFLYPTWWHGENIYPVAATCSWVVAIGYLLKIIEVLWNREKCGEKIRKNLIRLEIRRKANIGAKRNPFVRCIQYCFNFIKGK